MATEGCRFALQGHPFDGAARLLVDTYVVGRVAAEHLEGECLSKLEPILLVVNNESTGHVVSHAVARGQTYGPIQVALGADNLTFAHYPTVVVGRAVSPFGQSYLGDRKSTRLNSSH